MSEQDVPRYALATAYKALPGGCYKIADVFRNPREIRAFEKRRNR
jgi:hypothetical protein